MKNSKIFDIGHQGDNGQPFVSCINVRYCNQYSSKHR